MATVFVVNSIPGNRLMLPAAVVDVLNVGTATTMHVPMGISRIMAILSSGIDPTIR